MAPTRPSPVSFSEEEEEEYAYMSDNEAEEQQQQDQKSTNKANREEDEEEEEESDDEEEEGEETPRIPPLIYKRPSVPKPNPTTTDEGFESEPDSESDSQKTQHSPIPSDFTIKPIVDLSKLNKSTSKSPAVKRRAQTEEQNGVELGTKKRKVSNGDEERKSLFSRLWSEEDEVAILKGMVEYKSNKGADPYADMGAFHEFIKQSLHVDVSKNQLTDKIKRLKKKYRNNAEKGENPVFSKPHEHTSFEFSKKIWGGVASKGMGDNPKSSHRKATKSSTINPSLSLVKEEKHEVSPQKQNATVALNSGIKACSQDDFMSMYPRLSESLQSGNGNGLYGSLSESGRKFLKERMSLIGNANAEKLEEKWNKLQLDEIQLYLRRIELVREQTKVVLAEIKSWK